MKHLILHIVRLLFWLRLRGLVNTIQQRIANEHRAPRAPIKEFTTPFRMTSWALDRFDWRADKAFGAFDWSSPAEVMQARLNGSGKADGDCDDLAAWYAEVLERMAGATDVMRMSCWSIAKGVQVRGHTTVLFRFEGELLLADYQLYRVDSVEAALEHVRNRYGYGELKGWVFESTDLRLIAIYPKLPAI